MEFRDKLYVDFEQGKLGDEDKATKSPQMDTGGFIQPFRDIEKLQRTRFFVLILDEVEKLSYSHMQLGIAITVSKVVVLIGRKNMMSNTIKELREAVIQKIIVDDLKEDFDFEQDSHLVIQELSSIIKQNLPTSLGGYIEVD